MEQFMSNKKTLCLDANDVVVAVRLPSDNYGVSYGVREVDVELDSPFGVGDKFKETAEPEVTEAKPTTKGKKAE